MALDPNISEGEVATVEHDVALLVVGIVIVPVTPVGSGLTPGDAISVLPSGSPVGEAIEPVMPSGDVAPIIGVGVTVPSNGSSTCAEAALQTKSAGRTAAISRNFIGVFRLPTESRRQAPMSRIFATGSLAVRLSDIGHSPKRRRVKH